MIETIISIQMTSVLAFFAFWGLIIFLVQNDIDIKQWIKGLILGLMANSVVIFLVSSLIRIWS